jgi:hypothetical protein
VLGGPRQKRPLDILKAEEKNDYSNLLEDTVSTIDI